MRAYIEAYISNGEPASINFHIAREAFRFLGFHIISVGQHEQVPADDRDCVAVGSIAFMKRTFEHLGIALPAEDISYPDSLRTYLGRNIWTSTADEIASDPAKWNVFIKPKSELKRFTGKHIRNIADLRNIGDQGRNTPVWVSEPVHFLREWRVFVRHGRIMDIRPYKGDYHFHYDVNVIEAAIRDFDQAPAGYAIDFGVTDDGRTLLIEVNEGFSIGSYGLYYTDYAKLLSARWAELTGYEDLCNF